MNHTLRKMLFGAIGMTTIVQGSVQVEVPHDLGISFQQVDEIDETSEDERGLLNGLLTEAYEAKRSGDTRLAIDFWAEALSSELIENEEIIGVLADMMDVGEAKTLWFEHMHSLLDDLKHRLNARVIVKGAIIANVADLYARLLDKDSCVFKCSEEELHMVRMQASKLYKELLSVGSSPKNQLRGVWGVMCLDIAEDQSNAWGAVEKLSKSENVAERQAVQSFLEEVMLQNNLDSYYVVNAAKLLEKLQGHVVFMAWCDDRLHMAGLSNALKVRLQQVKAWRRSVFSAVDDNTSEESASASASDPDTEGHEINQETDKIDVQSGQFERLERMLSTNKSERDLMVAIKEVKAEQSLSTTELMLWLQEMLDKVSLSKEGRSALRDMINHELSSLVCTLQN